MKFAFPVTRLLICFTLVLFAFNTEILADEDKIYRISNAKIRTVATFNSISIYWKLSEVSSEEQVSVRYRPKGDDNWRQAHPLWFDARDSLIPYVRQREYRGSIVMLEPGTNYEIELESSLSRTRAYAEVKTWASEYQVGKKITLRSFSDEQLDINIGGSTDGYLLYEPKKGETAEIDVRNSFDYNIRVRSSYVIIRGLKLRNARIHAIKLDPGVHDVIIEHNDISGWGRNEEGGFGRDSDAAISNNRVDSPQMKRIIIQYNDIHHPRWDTNSWAEKRKGIFHPGGPQAIVLWNTAGNNVVRYNEIYSNDSQMFNDVIGGGKNFDTRGFPGPDSDIYGNKISHCWDDGIEAEGGGQNVRIWGNEVDKCYNSFGLSSVQIGPLYIFRNVSKRNQKSPFESLHSGRFIKGQSKRIGDKYYGGGRVYVYHNTIYKINGSSTNYGISASGKILDNYFVINNIIDSNKYIIHGTVRGGKYSHGLYNTSNVNYKVARGSDNYFSPPVYDSSSSCPYCLAAGTLGHDDGLLIPNFNDNYFGKGPDRGAQEGGSRPLKFGMP